ALGTAADGKFIPVPGGVLVLTEDGTVIGAVGISGDTSEKDEYCAIEAIRAVGLVSEPQSPDPNWRDSSLSGTAH
ncbi:MAG: heme-binding protein, partial [Opitutae bacterium]